MNQSAKISGSELGVLERVGWLAEQSADLRAWFQKNGRWKTYEKGAIVYEVGDDPDCLYGLGEGAIEVTLPFVTDEPVTLYRAELGFWIGESAILAGGPRVIGLGAAARSRLYIVQGDAIRTLLRTRPEFWPAFCALSLRNSGLAALLLAEVLSLSPRARLSRTLLRLSTGRVRIEVNQQELARLIGMNRSSLRRAMASLEEAGAVRQEYGSIAVTDRGFLESVANEP